LFAASLKRVRLVPDDANTIRLAISAASALEPVRLGRSVIAPVAGSELHEATKFGIGMPSSTDGADQEVRI
jgi:hypothetical protein